MPEIPRDTPANQTAPPWALQPDGCFSKPPLNSEPSNHLQISLPLASKTTSLHDFSKQEHGGEPGSADSCA